MKNYASPLASLSVVGLVALLTATSAGAETLYQFGPSGSLVSASSGLRLSDDSANAATGDINNPFGTGSMNTTAGSYSGPVFFGGWEMTNGAGFESNFQFNPQIRDTSPNDYVFLTLLKNDSETSPGSGVYNSGEFNFLMMGSFAATPLNQLDEIFFSSRDTGIGGQSREAIIQVDNGSGFDYYRAADDAITVGGYNTETWDVSSLTWYEYDPTSGLTNQGSIANLTGTENVTAAGGLFTLSLTAAGVAGNLGINDALRIEVQELTITAVPEPASAALLFSLVGAGFVFLRRRR